MAPSATLLPEENFHLQARLDGRRDPRKRSVQQVLEKVRERSLRFAELWLTDLAGRPWRLSVPTSHVDERLFESGMGLDGPSIGAPWQGLVRLMPDPAAAKVDPNPEAPTLILICDVLEADSNRPHPTDARQVLKRAERRLAESGAASTLALGAEPEFFVLTADGRAPAPEDEVWRVLLALAAAMEEAGLQVDGFRTGPWPGQGRVQMRTATALEKADETVLYRRLAAGVARRRGLRLSFLPKPLEGAGAASMPTHHALWRDGRNLFHDEDGWSLTSDKCRQYAGGLLAHAAAVMAFSAPTTNSYRRFLSPDAPSRLALSRGAADAACRIPARNAAAGARRIKFRLADSTANPYLAFAAMLQAGLDGIQKRRSPALEDKGDVGRPPRCLEEALDALDADRAFLKEGGVFDDALIDRWLEDRWKGQVLPVTSRPHPKELKLEA